MCERCLGKSFLAQKYIISWRRQFDNRRSCAGHKVCSSLFNSVLSLISQLVRPAAGAGICESKRFKNMVGDYFLVQQEDS